MLGGCDLHGERSHPCFLWCFPRQRQLGSRVTRGPVASCAEQRSRQVRTGCCWQSLFQRWLLWCCLPPWRLWLRLQRPAHPREISRGSCRKEVFDCRSELEVLKSLLGSQWPCMQLQQHGVFFLETNQLCWLVPLSPWHQNPQDSPRLSHAVNAVTTSFLPTQKPTVVMFCLSGSSGKVQQSPTRVPGPACPSQQHFLPGSALGIPLMRLHPAAITFYGSQPEAN